MSLEDIERILAELKPEVREVVSTKVLAAAGDYVAEDVLSESITLATPFTFGGMAKGKGGGGVIEKAIAFCSVTALTPRITLYLYSRPPTSALLDEAGNAGPNLNDHPTFQGQIDFPALEDLGGGSTSVATSSTYGNLPLPYKCESMALYGIAVTRDAIAGEAIGMTLSFKLQVKLD